MTNPYQIRLHKLLTDFIRAQNLEFTNPEIQNNIEKFGVLVNGKMCFNRQEWFFGIPEIDISNWPVRPKGNFEKVQILLSTENLCLVFKPIGTVCQAGNGHLLDNLETFLNENLKNSQSQNLENKLELENENSQKLFAAHRLDKDTQGLILFARNSENLEKLQSEFRKRLVVKKYLAIVDGIVEQNFHVNNWQVRDARNPICQKFFWKEKEAKEYEVMVKNAQSIIIPKVICAESEQTLIQVQILTGRMHQIRLQCQSLGFPLVNDPIYTTKVSLDETFQNPKSLLNSPYLFASDNLQTEISKAKFKHNFNSPKSDSTNSKQKKVSETVLKKLEDKAMSQAISHNFDNSLEVLINKNKQTQNDGFYSFYGTSPVLEMEKLVFEKLKLEIFGGADYCLLANFLGIQTPEFYLESEFFDLKSLSQF